MSTRHGQHLEVIQCSPWIVFRVRWASVPGRIGSQCRPGKIPIRMASGSGIIGLFNPAQALSGRTQVTATAPAASHGTGRVLAWPIRYGPTRCFRFSGTVRDRRQRPNRSPHQDVVRHQRLAPVRDFRVISCSHGPVARLRLNGKQRWLQNSKKVALLLLGRLLFDVFDDVADGLEFFRVFVRHFDPEFFLKSHHQFDNIQ